MRPQITAIRLAKDGVDQVLHAGIHFKTATFIDVFEQEARVAAYLGYKDVKDLRRFVVSYYFLFFFRYFNQPFAAGLRKGSPLVWIRDRFLEPGFEEVFPISAISEGVNPCTDDKTFAAFRDGARADLRTYLFAKDKTDFGPNDLIQQKQHLAHILIYMVATFSKCPDTLVVSDNPYQEVLSSSLQQRLQATIGAKYNAKHPPASGESPRSMKVPDVSGETVIVPKFETDLMESTLEKYNRAWNLLKYMRHCVSSLSIWPAKFEHRSWQSSTIIDRTYVPTWMQVLLRPPVVPKPQVPAVERYRALPKMSFEIVCKQACGKYRREELAEHLSAKANEGIWPPPASVDSTGDPRVHTQPQFRDSIRRDLGCEKLEVQLADCRLEIPAAPGEDGTFGWCLETCRWDWLREELQSAFDKGAQGNVKINVRLRPLLVEHEEELFESSELPPRLY